MRRIILSIAAAAVVATSLIGAAPAKAEWGSYGRPYYSQDNWRAQEWREHQYWAWRRHLWWQSHEHRGGYWNGGWYR